MGRDSVRPAGGPKLQPPAPALLSLYHPQNGARSPGVPLAPFSRTSLDPLLLSLFVISVFTSVPSRFHQESFCAGACALPWGSVGCPSLPQRAHPGNRPLLPSLAERKLLLAQPVDPAALLPSLPLSPWMARMPCFVTRSLWGWAGPLGREPPAGGVRDLQDHRSAAGGADPARPWLCGDGGHQQGRPGAPTASEDPQSRGLSSSIWLCLLRGGEAPRRPLGPGVCPRPLGRGQEGRRWAGRS